MTELHHDEATATGATFRWTLIKLASAAALAYSAYRNSPLSTETTWSFTLPSLDTQAQGGQPGDNHRSLNARRLQEVNERELPSYMDPLMLDLQERQKLFSDTPPEEVKYWFEYTGPLQKYFYRFSRTRGKADYFEGRDDSGVVSARFIDETGGGEDFRDFFLADHKDGLSDQEKAAHLSLFKTCLALGHSKRPETRKGSVWYDWFGGTESLTGSLDRCRVLFAINTVGAGRGTTMLWETTPPLPASEGPRPWMSEQETAATHLERNLREIDSLCATGLIAARVQILVCEPIPAKWTEWMDSQLVSCGGKPWPQNRKADEVTVEQRPSPLQVVVTASAATADTCHDLKSGFMEKRMQDLLLAPPFLENKKLSNDFSSKTTHPDLISSEDHDVYVAMKWSSLITIRAIHAFLQASADIAAAASSTLQVTSKQNGATILSNAPSSPFLIPSFVRVSYVSEENSKVAKWRMHGDFFHPAAWEICNDSFDMTWIPHSLAKLGGVESICAQDPALAQARRLQSTHACGQWWVYMKELQMPTSPEVYANEVSPAPVLGGSNFIWMVTERQRQEMVKGMVCRHLQLDKDGGGAQCPDPPQAVIPLGDLESFLINFTPNTALGKQHVKDRRPGYSQQEERDRDRQRVRERKQLHGQEDIEKALFDYTIYPAALFHKDATLKAARARDALLTHPDAQAVGPQTVKSSYYDVTMTKPRPPVMGWCQAIARRGLCTLFVDYFRTSHDLRCIEACGLSMDWAPIT